MAKTPKSKCAHPRHARCYTVNPGATETHYRCDDCGKADLGPPQDAVILPAGIYKLADEVPNWGKDGRSTDWDKRGVFPKGTYFVTENYRGAQNYGCRIKRHNGGYASVDPHHAGYDALAASLVPVEGTTEEFVDSLAGGAWAGLQRLS
jgi:hypothetical protein